MVVWLKNYKVNFSFVCELLTIIWISDVDSVYDSSDEESIESDFVSNDSEIVKSDTSYGSSDSNDDNEPST